MKPLQKAVSIKTGDLKRKIVIPVCFEPEIASSSVVLLKSYYLDSQDRVKAHRICPGCRDAPRLVCVHHADPRFCLFGCEKCRGYLIKAKLPLESQ